MPEHFEQKRLAFYLIDMKYIRDLSRYDNHVMSVSPQLGKDSRPFIGVIVICDSKEYCVPLSSPKAKHKSMNNDIDFMKIYDDDKLIAVLNFNNMIPVNSSVIRPLIIKSSKIDTERDDHYKKLVRKQLSFCQQNQDAIVKKANKLYKLVVSGKANHNLVSRCCDFKKLEEILEKRK